MESDYQFEKCCGQGCEREATFITLGVAGALVCYCDECGASFGLQRGIPYQSAPLHNHAEPEAKCGLCHSPIEVGIQCAVCLANEMQETANIMDRSQTWRAYSESRSQKDVESV
jgi:hypothetical protein